MSYDVTIFAEHAIDCTCKARLYNPSKSCTHMSILSNPARVQRWMRRVREPAAADYNKKRKLHAPPGKEAAAVAAACALWHARKAFVCAEAARGNVVIAKSRVAIDHTQLYEAENGSPAPWEAEYGVAA